MRRLPRVEVMLAIACAAGAIVLGASDLMTTFELTPPGGEPLQASEASERHNYALLVLGVSALLALVVALTTGSKPAAVAVAVSGGIALLIFLIGDLPDANRIGTLDDPRQSFVDARAEPQAGFWLQLIGSVVLTASGAALATMRPDQLRLLGPDGGSREEDLGDRERGPADPIRDGDARRDARRAAEDGRSPSSPARQTTLSRRPGGPPPYQR